MLLATSRFRYVGANMLRLRLSIFLFLACSLVARAGAQPQQVQPLRFSISSMGLVTRSNAPIDAVAELRWREKRLLEGRLEFELMDRDQVVGRYRSEEMTIAEGAKSMRFMLPPVKGAPDFTQIDVVPRFVTKDHVFDLGDPGDYQLRVPSESKRVFVIIASEPPDQVLSSLGTDVFRALR